MADKRKCVSCGKRTRRRCVAVVRESVCGEPLCSGCIHVSFEVPGRIHATISRFPPRNRMLEGPKFQHEDYGV